MSIRAIKEGLIKEDMLLDAFIRSANTSERPSVESLVRGTGTWGMQDKFKFYQKNLEV